MSWYAASIVSYVKFKDGNQDEYPIWENVVLIKASSDEDAFEKAKCIGKESDGDAFIWEDRPAVWQYAGIRKILSVDTNNEDASIGDGLEITYSQMLLKNKTDLDKFVEGDEIELIYEK